MSELLESVPWQRLAQLTGEYATTVTTVILAWLVLVKQRAINRLSSPAQQSCAERLEKSMLDSPEDWEVDGQNLRHKPTGYGLVLASGTFTGKTDIAAFGWGERRRLRRAMLGVLARHVERPPQPAPPFASAQAAQQAQQQANAARSNAGAVPRV